MWDGRDAYIATQLTAPTRNNCDYASVGREWGAVKLGNGLKAERRAGRTAEGPDPPALLTFGGLPW
jgi:hypothetical protein